MIVGAISNALSLVGVPLNERAARDQEKMGMTGNAVTVIRQTRFLALKGHDTNAQRSTPAVGAREFWDTRSQVGTLLHGMLSRKSERCTFVKAS